MVSGAVQGLQRSAIVQTPEATVMVPPLVKVPPLNSDVGAAPKGTVHPEEMIRSPPWSLVMVTRLNVVAPQVTVLSSALPLSIKATVPPLAVKVPAVDEKFLPILNVPLVLVKAPPVWSNPKSLIVMAAALPRNVPAAKVHPEEHTVIVTPVFWVMVPV